MILRKETLIKIVEQYFIGSAFEAICKFMDDETNKVNYWESENILGSSSDENKNDNQSYTDY